MDTPGKYSLPRHEAPVRLSAHWEGQLNAQQLAAVTAPDGPVLVLAGAGSGKTRVITYRAAFLIAERGVRPGEIMLATFTNKAARNMLTRVEDVVGAAARQITGGTFHHIANLLLRRYARLLCYDSSFTILDESDSRSVMKLARGEAGIDTSQRAFPSERLLVDIASSMVNSNLDLESLLARRFPQLLDQLSAIESVLVNFALRKAASNQMDFDDLLVNFQRLLAEQPLAAGELSARFRHILVDEYQDVNHLQASIVRLLYLGVDAPVGTPLAGSAPMVAQPSLAVQGEVLAPLNTAQTQRAVPPALTSNPMDDDGGKLSPPLGMETGEAGFAPTTSSGRGLFVVGDDAQSIYSFRGADYENIRGFPYAFAGAGVYKLEVNYRSTPEVLALANAVLHEGDPLFRKTLTPVRPSVGFKPLLLACRDTHEQAEFAAEQLMKLREDEAIPWRGLAVLYRAHSNRLETELELAKRRIPFVVRGGVRFFEQAHIKDLVSYLILLANSRDELAWQRVLLMAQRVGPRTAAAVLAKIRRVEPESSPLRRFIENGMLAELRGPARTNLMALQGFLSGLSRQQQSGSPPADLIGSIVEGRYREYMELQYDNWRSRLDDIEQLQLFAGRFSGLPELLSEVGLASGYTGVELLSNEEVDREEGAVTLSTIHQAKGLEWRGVLLIAASDDVLPHRMALSDPLGEDEERRLLYVAVTRAEEYLFISYPLLSETRDSWGRGGTGGRNQLVSRPSRFISGLPKDVYDEAVLDWD